MKPTKNKVFCISYGGTKMLFQSQAKADNFIKFNSNEIAAQSNKVPVRSYYCSFCCGWHITSVADETHAKIDDERDKHLWKQIHARTKKQLPSDELGVEINEMLSAIDILFKQIESAIKGVQLDVAQDLFKRSHLNLLRKYKMGDSCIFVLPQTISYKSPICTKYSAKIQ